MKFIAGVIVGVAATVYVFGSSAMKPKGKEAMFKFLIDSKFIEPMKDHLPPELSRAIPPCMYRKSHDDQPEQLVTPVVGGVPLVSDN